nr:phospholipase A2 inhibitor and Ly6/PLAUR domain-containing protein-like [Misgurnus anguillicaudatus]
MWLLLGFCLISSLIHSVQMLQCWDGFYQNASLKACPANYYYCAVLRSGNSPTLQTCLPYKTTCNFTTPTSVNLGFFDITFSCCNTDGCNNVSLPEKNNVPNGLKCDSCNNMEDKECKTPLSCVGAQECCFNMTDFEVLGNYTLKGCASKNFSGISSNSTISLSCYNKGNLNSTPKPTTTTSKYPPGNKSTSWLRVHSCSLLLMSLSAIFLKEIN